jgi:DNA-binding MarR family transcriptional regulator
MAKAKRPRVLPAAEHGDAMAAKCPWLEPGESGEQLDIMDFPTFMFTRLAATARNAVTMSYLESSGLSLPEWRLLTLVARYATLSFSEVTLGSSMDKGQVSRTLHSIHRKGLINLSSAAQTVSATAVQSALSPRVEVSITPSGQALYEQVLPLARARQVKLLSLMSLQEREVFYSVGRRLLQQLPLLDEDV